MLSFGLFVESKVKAHKLEVGLVELEHDTMPLFLFCFQLQCAQGQTSLFKVAERELKLVALLVGICELKHRIGSRLRLVTVKLPADCYCFLESCTGAFEVVKFLQAKSDHDILAHDFRVNFWESVLLVL